MSNNKKKQILDVCVCSIKGVEGKAAIITRHFNPKATVECLWIRLQRFGEYIPLTFHHSFWIHLFINKAPLEGIIL